MFSTATSDGRGCTCFRREHPMSERAIPIHFTDHACVAHGLVDTQRPDSETLNARFEIDRELFGSPADEMWRACGRVACPGRRRGRGRSRAVFTNVRARVTCPDCIAAIGARDAGRAAATAAV